MSVSECRIIELPKISDPRGNLTFVEGRNHIPFDIKRVYYLYDVPGGAERGGDERARRGSVQGADERGGSRQARCGARSRCASAAALDRDLNIDPQPLETTE